MGCPAGRKAIMGGVENRLQEERRWYPRKGRRGEARRVEQDMTMKETVGELNL